MDLDVRQTMIAAILVLFLGKYLNQKFAFLRSYNIPEPVTGGVLVALLLGMTYFLFNVEFIFHLDSRDSLLIVFFTCIGLSARVSTLMAGGKALVILLIAAVAYLFLQNITGISVASMTGLPAQVGVIGGSVSLSGGHGTAIAWAPRFVETYGIQNALEIGSACATFGLVLVGVIGGPIAKFLIQRYQLKSTSDEAISVGLPHAEQEGKINVDAMLRTILVIGVAVGIGTHLDEGLDAIGVHLPAFVSCLFAGILLTNTIPFAFKQMQWPTGTPTLALISDLSLGLFLAMSLMSLQLWVLADLAGPIIFLLIAQVLVVTLFVIFIVFRVLGRDYDAAVMASGYAGMGLGATPTAIANMTAVTERFGASPRAFIVIPLIGAFFIDIANAVIIQMVLGWID